MNYKLQDLIESYLGKKHKETISILAGTILNEFFLPVKMDFNTYSRHLIFVSCLVYIVVYGASLQFKKSCNICRQLVMDFRLVKI